MGILSIDFWGSSKTNESVWISLFPTLTNFCLIANSSAEDLSKSSLSSCRSCLRSSSANSCTPESIDFNSSDFLEINNSEVASSSSILAEILSLTLSSSNYLDTPETNTLDSNSPSWLFAIHCWWIIGSDCCIIGWQLSRRSCCTIGCCTTGDSAISYCTLNCWSWQVIWQIDVCGR